MIAQLQGFSKAGAQSQEVNEVVSINISLKPSCFSFLLQKSFHIAPISWLIPVYRMVGLGPLLRLVPMNFSKVTFSI